MKDTDSARNGETRGEADIVGLWREFRQEMAVIRDEAGGDGVAGIEAGAHGRSS